MRLARLRTGHSLDLRKYRHRLDDGVNPICQRCDDQVEEDVEHWLKCSAHRDAHKSIFGTEIVKPSDLTRRPLESAALARSTLLGAEQA